MARKSAANMSEPAPLRRSRRIALTGTATRTEKELLQHIAAIPDLMSLQVLKTQMNTEGIPKTKAVKKALEEQQQKIMRNAEEDVSPNAAEALKRASRRARRPLRKYPLRFGNTPGQLRKSRARRGMVANDWNKAIAAEEARLEPRAATPPPPGPALPAFSPVPVSPADIGINNITGRFGRMNLGTLHGPRENNGLNPWNRERTQAYLKRARNNNWREEGGGKRTRKTRRKSRRSRR